MIKKLVFVFAALCFSLTAVSCGRSAADKALLDKRSDLKQLNMPQKGDQIAIIDTSMGKIKMRLFAEYTPEAVENFVALAEAGYYNDILFHRVKENFIIQSGDPTGTGRGGDSATGLPIKRELVKELHHIRGAVAMARTDENVSQRSQFYIVQNHDLREDLADELRRYLDNPDEVISDGDPPLLRRDAFPPDILSKYLEVGGAPHLDYNNTVFGQVYEGMDVVDKIARLETDENDKPIKDVIVKSIKIVKY